jgi:hypothetical protein
MIKLDKEFMDPEKAESLLNVSIGKTINHTNLLKSFYNFDFSTPEGVISFIGLIPILDESIIKQAAAELWPGSVDDNFDVKRARFEIRGYLADCLSEGLLVTPEEEAEAAGAASNEVQDVEEAKDSEVSPAEAQAAGVMPGEEGEETPPGEEAPDEEEVPPEEGQE